MGQLEKLMLEVLSGKSDNNIRFADLQKLLYFYGSDERIKGDHFIYTKKDVEEIINIQPKGDKAKAYQVRQIRNLIIKYKL